MKTIEDIFGENLRRLRGERSQAAIAEKAGMHVVSYQRCESGTIPHRPNLEAIIRALGTEEFELFVDRTHYVPREAIEIQDGLTKLFEKFPKLDHAGRIRILNVLDEQLAKVEPESQGQVSAKR